MGYQAYLDEDEGVVVRTFNGNVDRVVYFASKADRSSCPGYYQYPQMFVRQFTEFLCPTIAVASAEKAEAGTIITFAAIINVGSPSTPLTYKWSLSAGTIIEGEGTDLIRVGTRNLKEKTIKATVEVVGVDSACSNKASSETKLIPP